MRNIVVLQDRIHEILHACLSENDRITCIATDKSASEVFVLTNIGRLFCFCISDFTLVYRCSWILDNDISDKEWFDVNYIAGIGSLVCVSRSGTIACIQDDINSGFHSEVVEQIGAIDGGICAAKWNPDQSCLVLVTNVDTIILMSNTWDVLEEVPMPARSIDTKSSVSWRGDGEFVSLVSTDKADGHARVRVLNRNLEVVATSRNVADGDASIMKGIGSAVAFAGNGSYIAVHQQRVKGKHQVALLERNGLRHGDFDIKTPSLPAGFDEWQVNHLEWDLPSNLLAVGLQAVPSFGTVTTDVPSVVQIYYRNNYYWYLKQQWEGNRLTFLGFDVEVVNRLYMSQNVDSPALRIVDIVWDVCNSTSSADSTTVVVDGERLLLTPLGISTVPPPMSLFTEQISQCCRYPTIWTPQRDGGQPASYEWGLCALGHKSKVLLFLGDKRGKVTQRHEIDLSSLLASSVLDRLILRSAVCSHLFQSKNEVHLSVALLGSRVMKHSVESSTDFPDNFTKDITTDRPHSFDCVDELLLIHISIDDSVKLVKYQRVTGIAGSVTRLTSVPGDATSLAMGVNNHIESSFDVFQVPISASLNEVQKETTLEESGAEHLVSLPETCSHLTIIRNDRSGEEEFAASDLMVVALSQKNRLYCNETLLVVGASSFVYNANYQLLMYITLGTRPHLHFSSLSQLAALNPLEGVRDDFTTTDFAEPRPVERGARLICSIANNSKVIIQLPRGNLELFEPRPLILMKAQSLMNANEYLECLILLRRQRVDLNYLVDFKPALFLQNVDAFVKAAFTSNAELLSLLVSSIEPWDVTLTKYHLHSNAKRSIVGQDASMIGDNKVNTVCKAIRDALLPLLQGGQTASINPILCTYAKQKPAQLVEALKAIRDTNKIANPASTSLSTPIVLSSIKYLAFLADGQLLFDAALGICDFEMARGVGRQCQMDPKVYLPLLERFEKLGKGFEEGSPQVALMHFKVNMHLNRYEKVVEHGARLLGLLQSESDVDDAFSAEVKEVVRSMAKIIDQQDLYSTALPRLYGIASNKKPINEYAILLSNTLSDVRVSYAEKCITKMNYAEAVNAFLSAKPARAVEAVQAARQLGNWQQALAIAGRYYLEERYKTMQNDIMPQRVAQSIVNEFKENQEQGESYGTEIENGAISSAVETAAHDDKVLEAARLCVEYCDDAESAVAILTTAKRWLKAYQVALRYNRKDLQDEITISAVSSGKELLKVLPARSAKFSELIAELSTIWADPADRLQKVSTTDAALLEDLQGGPQGDANATSDTASEYSAVTQQSVMSYRSDASSVRSGTSTVSILSQLSQQSQTSQTPSTSAFSIEGLDHSLLSRGKASQTANNPIDPSKTKEKVHKRDNTPRGIKRKEKSKTRGGKDVWGLRRETAVSDELLSFSNVAALASNVSDTCDLLVLLGKDEYINLATELHRALDAHIEVLTASPPPVAPLYPYEWLQRRAMLSVARYQDAEALKAAAVEAGRDNRPSTRPVDLESWWKMAADGIKKWKSQQSIVFKN